MLQVDVLYLNIVLAQLYATALASKENTGGGEGVEVIKNEPYEKENEKGQYTYKIFRLASRVPAIVKAVAPAGALDLYEEVCIKKRGLLNKIMLNYECTHAFHYFVIGMECLSLL